MLPRAQEASKYAYVTKRKNAADAVATHSLSKNVFSATCLISTDLSNCPFFLTIILICLPLQANLAGQTSFPPADSFHVWQIRADLTIRTDRLRLDGNSFESCERQCRGYGF